jgi:predicted nuclease of predicted toxin-antitoxin system
MRFLLDEGIHPRVAEEAWAMELDVVSVHDVRRRGWSDREQLEYAAWQDRILVTRNRADYLHLTREFFQGGHPHAGLLLLESGFPNDHPEVIARALRRWVAARSYGNVRFGAYHVDVLKR